MTRALPFGSSKLSNQKGQLKYHVITSIEIGGRSKVPLGQSGAGQGWLPAPFPGRLRARRAARQRENGML